MKRSALVLSLLACCCGAIALPAAAQLSVNINVPGLVQAAPPPPRYEVAPRPRSGQVWIPGRWQWTGRDYAWTGGQWQRARPDYAYQPGSWVRADGGWRWREGDWRRAERREAAYEPRQDRGERYDRGDRDDRDHRGDRYGRRDHHDRKHHDREHHGHGGDHCPPGQAKKGRC